MSVSASRLERRRLEPWPIGLAVFLVLFAAGVIAFTLFSATQREDLVSRAYYQDEVRFQEQIDRETQALRAGAVPTVTVDGTRPLARVVFPTTAPLPESGEIALYRPSDAALDRRLPLRLDADRAQEIALTGLPGGLWRVRLRWTAGGHDYAAQDVLVVP